MWPGTMVRYSTEIGKWKDDARGSIEGSFMFGLFVCILEVGFSSERGPWNAPLGERAWRGFDETGAQAGFREETR